ncbi:MAG TPA: 2-succinyl-5-enolpyruvyl-6-hydroxy-3-cyclohexene-1-carboxylic-acid synthase [Longimicrobiales bacterium]|nr:2-succinyl-5-enolpyruvyl-6-hydroxy-3-cyclohexene-1-carboxylic-acid synthase [Longimicrobiales bacterium]
MSDLLTQWARLLVASARQAGVTDAVLSPGSRSTPFTWAALHDPGLRCHTVIDERSAAFFALGMARMTGRPAALICTSGSAAANYFPAVVEAAESGTPLLVITADRPFELQHAAAPQTIDQTRLFGDFARGYFDLGMPDADPAVLRAVQRVAAQAVHATRSPLPGPVQVNARARKPLEPVHGESALTRLVDELVDRGPTRSAPAVQLPAEDAIARLAEACRSAGRGLIVCGPTSPWQAADPRLVADLAAATGFPVVPEAASQQRFPGDLRDDTALLDAFPTLLEDPGFRTRYEPDLVLHLGRPPTASAWNAAMTEWRSPRFVVWPHGWADPWSSATHVIQAGLDATIRPLLAHLRSDTGVAGAGVAGSTPPSPDWVAGLLRANAAAWASVDAVTGEGFVEGTAVRAVFDALPEGSVLALGNSLPIRHADTFLPAAARGITVWSQRGANGIDGLISGAAGAAMAGRVDDDPSADASPGGRTRPVTLLVGDVSFVHDLGGLAVARDVASPLDIVILNNGGGRIFERLPIADRFDVGRGSGGDPSASGTGDPAGPAPGDAWLTPPRVDFEAAAAAFGVPYVRCRTAAEIATALGPSEARTGTAASAGTAPGDGARGCRVVEVVLPGDTATASHATIHPRGNQDARATPKNIAYRSFDQKTFAIAHQSLVDGRIVPFLPRQDLFQAIAVFDSGQRRIDS